MNWFNNLKIRSKLITGVVLGALLIGFTGLIGYTAMNTMHAEEDKIANKILPSIQALQGISQAHT